MPIELSAGDGVARRMGIAGLEVSLMHNLNTETRTLPALGLRADVLAPVGPLAPDRTYATFTGMLTRTFRAMRVHLNGPDHGRRRSRGTRRRRRPASRRGSKIRQ